MKMKLKSRIATGLATFSLIAVSLLIDLFLLIAVSLLLGGEIRVKFEGTARRSPSPVKKVDGRY